MPSLASFLSAAALSSLLVGFAASQEEGSPCDGVPTLHCSLQPTTSLTLEGTASSVAGTALFRPEVRGDACVARIVGAINGLGDDTPHGWHIHEFGDISSPDGSAAGDHFNPDGVDHALPIEGGGNVRHVGDLGNLFPDANGVAQFNFVLDIDLSSVAGRGVIVHADEDDGGQPTGNAGARLGQCKLTANGQR